MKLTERDKTLLFILGVLVILCIPYFFVVRPFGDRKMQLQREVTDLQKRKDYLDDLLFRKDEYIVQTKQIREEKEQVISRFPTELPQEGNILFLHNTEERIPIALSQVSFETETQIPLTNQEEAASGDAAETGTAGAGVMSGLCASSQIIYSANYENFKSFLIYILNNSSRMIISDLNAVFSADTNLVTGNLILKQYALQGTGREAEKVAEPELLHGTSNVFMQALGGSDASETGEKTEDFFLMLSQPQADVESVIFGQSMDGTGRTHLTSDENSVQEMAVSFRGSGGTYVANYQIGDEKFSDTGEGISFDKEENIVFEIISSPRVGEEDKVGTRLDVINETDLEVVIHVKNDDEEMPRVEIASQTGEVRVENP